MELEPTMPVNEVSYGKNEEFFLFASILDASMIDKKLGEKPVYFEISIGNAGNAIDGHNESRKDAQDSDSEELGKSWWLQPKNIWIILSNINPYLLKCKEFKTNKIMLSILFTLYTWFSTKYFIFSILVIIVCPRIIYIWVWSKHIV